MLTITLQASRFQTTVATTVCPCTRLAFRIRVCGEMKSSWHFGYHYSSHLMKNMSHIQFPGPMNHTTKAKGKWLWCYPTYQEIFIPLHNVILPANPTHCRPPRKPKYSNSTAMVCNGTLTQQRSFQWPLITQNFIRTQSHAEILFGW
jgi:hypothetical protein